VGEGKIVFDRVSQTPGAEVTGHFEGEMLQTQMGLLSPAAPRAPVAPDATAAAPP
jgi:hypothetical protein